MKTLIATTSALFAATYAAAGSVAYVAPEVTMIEEQPMMGGSGAWLIPLVIIAVLALALTNNNQPD